MATVSSYRLLLIIFTLNFLIGVSMSIYANPIAFDTELYSGQTELHENYEEEFGSETGLWGQFKKTTADIVESTIGNAVVWGRTIWNIFLKGINPFSFSALDFEHPIEKMFARTLILARLGMMSFLLLDAIRLWKNRA